MSGKVDPEAVATSANAGRILSELAANLPNSGGVLGWFMGENNFDDFAARIVPFGEAIAEYSEKVSGKVDSEAVATSANAGRILSELAAELPNSSGIISWFTGDNDLSAFAKKIVPFGYAISEYSEAVSGKIDSEAVEASANAGRALSGLAAALPDNGGIISWFTGDNDLKSFADKLVPFGEALADYSEAVSGKVDVDSIKASTRAGKALASLAVELPDGGGIISWFTGSNDLGNFASKLVPFGEALADYSEAVSGKVDVSSVRASTRAGKALASMAAEIPDSGGLFGWFLGQNNIDDFGNRIKVFGEAIAAYSEAVE